MAHVILLHSAIGLRPAVLEFADALRQRGHTVDTPDYYEGRVFDDEATGVAFRDEVGPKVLLGRVKEQIADAPADAVLAGFSLGAFFSQALAGSRPQAKAAILLHSVTPPRNGEWNGVPVQVHRYEQDHWIKPEDVESLKTAVEASGAAFDDIVVPGKGHLFTDLGMPDGDADALTRSIDAFDAFIR